MPRDVGNEVTTNVTATTTAAAADSQSLRNKRRRRDSTHDEEPTETTGYHDDGATSKKRRIDPSSPFNFEQDAAFEEGFFISKTRVGNNDSKKPKGQDGIAQVGVFNVFEAKDQESAPAVDPNTQQTSDTSGTDSSMNNLAQRINHFVDVYERDGKYCSTTNVEFHPDIVSGSGSGSGSGISGSGSNDIRDYCEVISEMDKKLKCPLTLNIRDRKIQCPFSSDRRDMMQMHYAAKHPNTRKLFRIVIMDDISHCEMCSTRPEDQVRFNDRMAKLYHYHLFHNSYIRHFCPHERCMRPYANLTHSSPWAHRKNHHRDDPLYVSKTLKPFYAILRQFINSTPTGDSSFLEMKKTKTSKNSKKSV